MKKVLMIITVVLIIIAIILFMGAGCGFGLGNGTGAGDGEGTRSMETMQKEEAEAEEIKEEVENVAEEKTEEVVEYLNLKISVVESDYFYENERIALDKLVEKIQSTDGNLMVEVIDDNASLKSYNKLLEALDDLRIDYIEK